MDSLQPWNHCGQFGHATMEHAAILAMDSLQPFWPCGYRITFGHGGHGIAAANLPMRPWDRCGHFGHFGHEIAIAILAILAMESL